MGQKHNSSLMNQGKGCASLNSNECFTWKQQDFDQNVLRISSLHQLHLITSAALSLSTLW